MEDFLRCTINSVHIVRPEHNVWYTAAPRKYDFLAYQVTGSYTHELSDKTLLADSDKLLYLNKNDTYSAYTNEHGYSICIAFANDIITPSFVIDCKSTPNIGTDFKRLLKYSNLKLDSNYCSCMSIFYGVLAFIKKSYEAAYMSQTAFGNIMKVKNYIDENYSDSNLDNTVLSSVCGFSSRHMCMQFHNKFNITPRQYIIDTRVDAAMRLLDSSEYSVSRIAEMVGFKDVYYFSNVFKHKLGISPTQYKRQNY